MRKTIALCLLLATVVTPASAARESMTYLYAGTTTSYLKVIDTSGGALGTICPDYFDINPDGSLLITPSNKIDKAFIDELHSRGMLVTPFLSNHWDKDKGNAALNNRAALSTQIANMVAQYNLDGVNVDIENVNEKYRAAYTDFVRLLREKLPKHKLVTVAVAANPKGWTLGWHGSYDYKALSDYSDYLMLMTYDESYYGSDEGPVSSARFFEDSIKYAINQGVPKSKIVAGLPFFGRFWKQGSVVGGYGLTNNDTQYLMENYDYTVQYHEYSQSANVKVTIKASDPKPKLWGGRVLDAGTYSIWCDDERATRWKLELIDSYDLLGAGSWSLGQENPAVWTFYTAALNGTTVTQPPVEPQVPQSPDTTHSLERIVEILNRLGPKTYNKNSVLTRAEVAAVLSELVYLEPAPNGATFADTSGHWAEGQINALKMRLIVNGNPDGNFYPDQLVTREELLAILDRMLVLPTTIDYHIMTFKDVPPSRWSYANIAKMYYFELIRGYSADYFKPVEKVTAEILSIIYDRIEAKEYPINPNRHITSSGMAAPRRFSLTPQPVQDVIIEPR